MARHPDPRPATRPVTRPVTLREIAHRTGVHESTVSRALNDRTRHLVAGDVAARIAATARDLGYRPNIVAAALRTRRTMAVGALVANIADPATARRLAGAEVALRDAGYTLTVLATGDDAGRLGAALDALDGRAADGAILFDHPPKAGTGTPPWPLVLPADIPDAGASGITDAVAWLATHGHRTIGHLAGPPGAFASTARQNAYRDAMTAAGLFVGAIAGSAGFDAADGQRAAEILLARRPNLTALVTADDRLALGAFDALAARGLHCPQDISITGIGDLPFAARTSPRLTTMRIDHEAAGRAAAALLLARIADPDANHSDIASPEAPPAAPQDTTPIHALVVRGSTGPAPQR